MNGDGLKLEVDAEVIDFIRLNISEIEMDEPVPALIYGRFGDETEEEFRVAPREGADISPRRLG